MRVIVLIVVALLPVQECACTTGTEWTSANRIYSAGAYSVRILGVCQLFLPGR